MPRGAKKTAHQHNSRHENGVVAPGKRITKQKSNGNIDASAEGSPRTRATPSSSSVTQPSVQVLDKTADNSSASIKNGTRARDLSGSKDSGDVSEDAEPLANGPTNGVLEHSHRKIDVNAAKSPTIHEKGVMSLALTILWSCPIADTIAILIFLLALPPTFLALTNTLFAILTFMPPANSFSSFPTTLNDVFQASGGAPSLATIILTDLIGLILWLVVWTPVQVLSLELAQAVVATTLGGGNSVKNKGSDNTFICMGLVVVSHVARHKWIPNRFFGYDWSVRLASLSNMSLGQASFSSSDIVTPRTYASWFRLLITLHILIQGLVHVVRRWYARKEHQRPTPSNKRSDPEATIESPARPEIVPPGSPVLTSSTFQDLAARSSLPNMREPRDKSASNKKKKKQGTYVRSQQPLWAAFAATKVTICREFDQSKVLQEASGSNATDTKNLGSAPFLDQECQVWITNVRPRSFSFDTSHFASYDLENGSTVAPAKAVVDRSRPFYIRVNGAHWTSARVERLPKHQTEDGRVEEHWTGEVFGLSPSSSYICSFVRSEDDVEIFTTSLSTQSSPMVDNGMQIQATRNAQPLTMPLDISALANPPLQPHRPASPTSPATTLKNSIAACEASLTESQARHKRGKKDSKALTLSMRKEIESFTTKIAKLGGDDKAQTSRQLQWNQHMRQADEAVAVISSELDSMGAMPEDDLKQWQQAKRQWELEKDNQNNAREELFRCKDSAHQEKSAAQAEGTSTQQKRDRLTTRVQKLNEHRERLLSATTEGLSEKERREAEMAAKSADRRQFEEKSQEQAINIQRSIQEAQFNAQQAWQQAQVFQSAHQQQQMINSANDEPTTPEGNIPGTVPATASVFRFPGLSSTDQSTLRGGAAGSHRFDARPRSTSAFSGNSLYAEFDDQDPAPPMPSLRPIGKLRARNASGSSGSGSGGSQRDSMSPIGAFRPSPVDKRSSPVWS